MLFDALAKRLLSSPDVLAGLLAAAHPDLPKLLDLASIRPLKELPTFQLHSLVPDLVFSAQFSHPSRWPSPALLQPDLDQGAALIIEASSSPGPRTLRQVNLYLAQLQLAGAEQGRGWTPAVAVVFTLGPRGSRLLRRAVSWPQEAQGIWKKVAHPLLVLVESRNADQVARAAEWSACLGFAMEVSVAASQGLEAVRRLMEEWGRALMEERVRYREAKDHKGLLGIETVLQFLLSLAARQKEEATGWVGEVRGWWKELGRAFGLSEEDVMAEMKPAFEWLIQDRIEEVKRRALDQGFREGREEGQRAALRGSVYDVLEERFGRVPDSVRAYVEGISEMERLREVLRRALRVERPEDLLNGH